MMKIISLNADLQYAVTPEQAADVVRAISVSGLRPDDFRWAGGSSGSVSAHLLYKTGAFFAFDSGIGRGPRSFEYGASLSDPGRVCGFSLNWPQQLRRFDDWLMRLRGGVARLVGVGPEVGDPTVDQSAVGDKAPAGRRPPDLGAAARLESVMRAQFERLDVQLSNLRKTADEVRLKDWRVVVMGVILTLGAERLTDFSGSRDSMTVAINRASAWIAYALNSLQTGRP
jgi:hypothetical protein